MSNDQQTPPAAYNPQQWPLPHQQQPFTPAPPLPPQPGMFRERKPRPKWILPVGLVIGGMILGAGFAGSTRPAASVAAPETKISTPASCIEALDLADKGFGIAADAIGYASEAMGAAADFDVSGIRDASEGIKGESAKIVAMSDDYKTSREACKDSR